jgi:antitoxin component of MazEF toxin-antitoxin module
VTVPNALADQYGVRPGDEIEWHAAGDAIRVVPVKSGTSKSREVTAKERLEIFDQAMERR